MASQDLNGRFAAFVTAMTSANNEADKYRIVQAHQAIFRAPRDTDDYDADPAGAAAWNRLVNSGALEQLTGLVLRDTRLSAVS